MGTKYEELAGKESPTELEWAVLFMPDNFRREVAANELASLREREKRLREMLKKHQWAASLFYDYVQGSICPECGMGKELGHTPGCKWAALLKEGE